MKHWTLTSLQTRLIKTDWYATQGGWCFSLPRQGNADRDQNGSAGSAGTWLACFEPGISDYGVVRGK